MTIFKPLAADDRVSTKTLLHEAIPITGTIVSGTYGAGNIQNFTHGMFQSVYDYPYLSSSANHIFDITFGTSTDSGLVVTNQEAKKDNIYNQMAQVLSGYDKDGNIQRFDEDGNIVDGGTKLDEIVVLSFSRLLAKDEIKKGSFELELGVSQAFIEDGSMFAERIKITDTSGSNGYKVNSPAGEYGILFASSSATTGPALLGGEVLGDATTNPPCGLLYYQAGIAILSSSVFQTDHASFSITATNGPSDTQTIQIIAADSTSVTFTAKTTPGAATDFARNGTENGLTSLKSVIEASALATKVSVSSVIAVPGGNKMTISQLTAGTTGNTTVTSGLSNYTTTNFTGGGLNNGILAGFPGATTMNTGGDTLKAMLIGSQISSSADALRSRIYNMQFNNTIELNSTVYFCRAKHNEFNYSSNPTYLSGSQVRVKNESTDIPISYITSIGLYSADNQLLAVGKFSEPVRKDSNIELTFRARLDY